MSDMLQLVAIAHRIQLKSHNSSLEQLQVRKGCLGSMLVQLQVKRSAGNTTDGSRWIVQILSTKKLLKKDFEVFGRLVCRKELNHPLIAVRWIS